MTIVSRVPSVVTQDQIDLFALIQSVWRRRGLIAAVAVLSGALAAGYAFTATPVYEVSTILRPAALNDMDALNRSQVYSLPPSVALTRVGAALESYETRLAYFRSSPELLKAFSGPGQTPEQAFEVFNKTALSIVLPDPKKTDLLSTFLGLEMRYPKGIQGDDILNGFVQFAIEHERSQISADLKIMVSNRLVEVDEQIKAARDAYQLGKAGEIAGLMEADNLKRAELQDELKALRVQLKSLRESRISSLDEAITIARSLGIKKPSTPSSMAREAEPSGNVIRTEVTNQQIPLYFMGVDALEAERRVLRQRVSDDFADPRVAQIHRELQLLKVNRKVQLLERRQNEDVFLKGMDALREEKARLMNIPTDLSHLNLVVIDRQALEPVSPVKPKKALIIALGILGGALLGTVLMILRYMLRLRRVRVVPVGNTIDPDQPPAISR
ncbi:Wzz/FepE/Etk N-terminal domain-containing protein [Pseudomonas sp. 5P_5.1_Bac1]|uniref:Wzz/FepE/Etk N-terminal domain-containing protein n=1 Tax=Pseudomonas sp. 5P_5.1_Bac1 TaxID=2971616 RepID=UPI0021CA0063|nr:Wzz/FepE/Etk N-terminal domain-containing protein [Pseudomonas sp. 5P_5.1_Bac1]MCU1722221.1 Wzz/FepE/Etk N-terminal domain-containing protein [Pseudomonas sp. 5P_5.1_Bac1]